MADRHCPERYRQLVELADVDPRTVARFFEHGPAGLRDRTRRRIEAALARLEPKASNP